MSYFRDTQHGVNDPVDGVDVKHQINTNQTPHERAQRHADVRAKPTASPSEPFLPERLRREPTGPINPRTGLSLGPNHAHGRTGIGGRPPAAGPPASRAFHRRGAFADAHRFARALDER